MPIDLKRAVAQVLDSMHTDGITPVWLTDVVAEVQGQDWEVDVAAVLRVLQELRHDRCVTYTEPSSLDPDIAIHPLYPRLAHYL